MGQDLPKAAFDPEKFRDYLLVLARLGLPAKLRRRLGPSDIVQETILEAYRAGERLQARSSEEQASLMRTILSRNLANAVRDHGRERRNVALDRSLDAALAGSSAKLSAWLASVRPSPSDGLAREEEQSELVCALAELSDVRLEAVVLRHVHGWSLAAVAEKLGLSRHLVTRELRLATAQLQKKLQGNA